MPSKVTPLTTEQRAAILDRQGHEPCPGLNIHFKVSLGQETPDGSPLHATIFHPAVRPNTPTPVLLAYHGGGYGSSNPDGCGAIAKQLALTLGITTVSASYRLTQADKPPTYPGILADAIHAHRWILANADALKVDPCRIMVSGDSAGVILAGHLAVGSPQVSYYTEEPRPAAFIAQWGCMDFVALVRPQRKCPGRVRSARRNLHHTPRALPQLQPDRLRHRKTATSDFYFWTPGPHRPCTSGSPRSRNLASRRCLQRTARHKQHRPLHCPLQRCTSHARRINTSVAKRKTTMIMLVSGGKAVTVARQWTMSVGRQTENCTRVSCNTLCSENKPYFARAGGHSVWATR